MSISPGAILYKLVATWTRRITGNTSCVISVTSYKRTMKEVCPVTKPYPHTGNINTTGPCNDPVMASYTFMIDFHYCLLLDNLKLRINASLECLRDNIRAALTTSMIDNFIASLGRFLSV
jgi:hypothetical protein